MKVIRESKDHEYFGTLMIEPPHVGKALREKVTEEYYKCVEGSTGELLYHPMYQSREVVHGLLKYFDLLGVVKTPYEPWGSPPPFQPFVEAVEAAEPIAPTFGKEGNVFMSWYDEIEAFDRSKMQTSDLSNGDLMTMEQWIGCVETGGFIDYDGFGRYSNGIVSYDEEVRPSMVERDMIDKTFSHVLWFNR